jgi:hypothetical protein
MLPPMSRAARSSASRCFLKAPALFARNTQRDAWPPLGAEGRAHPETRANLLQGCRCEAPPGNCFHRTGQPRAAASSLSRCLAAAISAAWRSSNSRLRCSGAAASRTTNHRRQPSPPGSIRHDRTTGLRPRRVDLASCWSSTGCHHARSTAPCGHQRKPATATLSGRVIAWPRHGLVALNIAPLRNEWGGYPQILAGQGAEGSGLFRVRHSAAKGTLNLKCRSNVCMLRRKNGPGFFGCDSLRVDGVASIQTYQTPSLILVC